MTYTVSLPIRTKSALNLREHWAARSKRVAEERRLTALFWPRNREVELPAAIRLVRVSPRLLDSGDNLSSAMKAVRDELARIIGVNDRDARVDWLYGQAKGAAAVLVIVECGPGTHVAANCSEANCRSHWRAP